MKNPTRWLTVGILALAVALPVRGAAGLKNGLVLDYQMTETSGPRAEHFAAASETPS